MKVFKNYFKIVWAHKTAIILYTIIFAVIMSFSTKGTKEASYKSIDVRIYLKDNANTSLSKALCDYLNTNAKPIDMDESLVEDKLFYANISCALEIPKDFDQTKKVLYKAAPDEMYAMSVKEKVNIYLSQVAAYEAAGFSEDDAIKYTKEDLDKKFDVEIKEGSVDTKRDNSRIYFNFLNYVLLAQAIMVVATIVKVYRKKPILMRNLVSPMPRTKINLQMMLGHIVTGLCLWLLYMVLFVLMYKYDFTKTHINLMMLNSFIFTITVVAMSVMIANLIKSENAISGVMNVVSLGSSFLCGAFAPQELLGDTALTLGRVFPGFYYIQSNDMLMEKPEFSTMLPNVLIMVGFAIAFIIISVVAKPKANDNIN